MYGPSVRKVRVTAQYVWFNVCGLGRQPFVVRAMTNLSQCDVVAHGLVREVRDVAQKLCLFATMVIPSKIESIIFLYIQITAVTYPFQIFLSSY